MRLVSYRRNGEPGVGVMVDDKGFVALPKAAPDLPRSLRALIELEGGFQKAAAAAKGKAADHRLNYKLHINETGLTTSSKYPQIFLRMPCAQVGHLQPIVCPDPSVATKYEYE